jgi:hypothetical protein
MSRSRIDRHAIAILSVAVVVGTWLRFEHLDRVDFTPGEAVSWVAASAPTIREVLASAIVLNPGKLGVHDVALHLWMDAFGDGLTTMRAMSACLGMLAILLTFAVVRELMIPPLGEDATRLDERRDWIAATAALLVALNLPLIYYSRAARMYMVLVPAILAQVWFFLRAHRIGGRLNYCGTTAFSALALATHFTAGSVMVAEVLRLAPELLRGILQREALRCRATRLVIALAAGGLILSPVLYHALGIGYGFFASNGFRWVPRPGPFAPITFLVMGLGEATNGPVAGRHQLDDSFIVITTLAAWGAISFRREGRSAVTFALLWFLTPIVLPQVLSWIVTPFLLLEYTLSSFVAVAILTAIGIHQIGGFGRYAALALLMAFLFGPIQRFRDRTSEPWGKASELVSANLGPHDVAMVDPGWTVDAVHYYLRAKPNSIEAAPNRVWQLRPPLPNLLMITDYAARNDPVGLKLLSLRPQPLQRFAGISVYRISPDSVAQPAEVGVQPRLSMNRGRPDDSRSAA